MTEMYEIKPADDWKSAGNQVDTYVRSFNADSIAAKGCPERARRGQLPWPSAQRTFWQGKYKVLFSNRGPGIILYTKVQARKPIRIPIPIPIPNPSPYADPANIRLAQIAGPVAGLSGLAGGAVRIGAGIIEGAIDVFEGATDAISTALEADPELAIP